MVLYWVAWSEMKMVVVMAQYSAVTRADLKVGLLVELRAASMAELRVRRRVLRKAVLMARPTALSKVG